MSATGTASEASGVHAGKAFARPSVRMAAPPAHLLPRRAAWALAQLSPELAREVGSALTGRSKHKDFISPRTRDDDTKQMDAMAMLDAFRALGDYGMVPASVAEMVTPEALDVLRNRVDDVIWEEINLSRVLLSLRKVYRYIHLKPTPGPLRHRISYHLGAARRHQWDYLRTPAECIAGAVAAAGLADVMSAAGQEKLARSRFRDAVILAVAAEANFRTQEFCYVDIGSIEVTVRDGLEQAELSMAAQYCKNRKARIGVVSDPVALALLRRLMGARKDGPLFCTYKGRRMDPGTIATALRRTALLTLGVPLSANLLRRAGVSDEEDEAEMAKRIGDSPGGRRIGIAVKHYGKSVAWEGTRPAARRLTSPVSLVGGRHRIEMSRDRRFRLWVSHAGRSQTIRRHRPAGLAGWS